MICFASGRRNGNVRTEPLCAACSWTMWNAQTAAGKKITSRLEGRVTVKDE
ncbi:MAG: hypothetical protein ACLUE2_06755 [Bacteroides cellulosilyticus]